MENLNGLLLVNKPQNMTSFDVVAIMRKKLHVKKIGHSGTLDPMAEGALLLLIGKATKILPYLENTDKEYIATFELGKQTDTEDIWGNVIEEKEVREIDDLSSLCHSFIGKQKQLPPMVSSIKVNGKKLYEYARDKIEVERPLRDIEIYDIEVLDKNKIRVSCSSGTYIRSLIRDMALQSGNIGCMSSLIRTRIGNFTLDDCYQLDEVDVDTVQLHSIYEALNYLPMIEIENERDVMNGKKLRLDTKEDRVLMVKDKEALAIYQRHHQNIFSCERGLW
ncbi:tRNA pseudouridine(55) synthase TruB [uncultured Traorella sp.]|uniref:tRNA pseudouridine(55) synthase TruB n=1 Tax=uncultured Traorella sp. TaxID=1929048 RepID=UPI0025CDE189|nr:tRNA pseudouridine(55) synthase TruB [uncultured Traorella sp.]